MVREEFCKFIPNHFDLSFFIHHQSTFSFFIKVIYNSFLFCHVFFSKHSSSQNTVKCMHKCQSSLRMKQSATYWTQCKTTSSAWTGLLI